MDKEEALDRFYEESELPLAPCCKRCDEYRQCDLKGHEDIGWCMIADEFMEGTDCCEDWNGIL
jgi:hypothetical protein